MINLLPGDRKVGIRAARSNVILLRYTGILLMAFLFIMGVLYVYYSVLQNTMASAETRIEANDIKADVYSETRAQVEDLENRLTEAKTTLDQETRYSKFLVALGQVTPQGTIIDGLTLDDAHFNGTAFEIKVYAQTNEQAVAAGNQLKAATQLFTQLDIQTTSETGGIEGYPFAVTMSATLNKAGAM